MLTALLHFTAAQRHLTPFERFTASHRKASNEEELASRAARRVSVHVAEDGSVAITARLPATDGA